MPGETIGVRLKHAWNAFRNKDPTSENYGYSSSHRPDRVRMRRGNEQSIVTAVYNRIAIDVASISIQHVRTDQNGNYEDTIQSNLNYALHTEANLDQSSKAFMQDIVMSMFDEGCVAVVPIDTTFDPTISGSYDVQTLRTGKLLEWFPEHVRVEVYNDRTGFREELTLPKKMVAIIENPLYAIMNGPNSTLQRLIRKLNILDAIDEQSGSGKLDLIIQLPYAVKNDTRRRQADERRKNLEDQLMGSRYGIGYTDATERITQLNRPAENNLMSQIEYLTNMLYSQLGLTENVFNGSADENEMLNYISRTIVPILSTICDEFARKFLTRTARTQNQAIMYFRDAFKLAPVGELANIADKFTRNEILSSNEVRAIIGYKPSKDPAADELRNKNLNQSNNPNRSEQPPNGSQMEGDSQNG